jgi:hypothetical protein
MSLTNVTQLGPGIDHSAQMIDANNNNKLNATDTLTTTFPGDTSPTTLSRINTNLIDSTGNGFGAGEDTYAVWTDNASPPNHYLLITHKFDETRITNGNLDLTVADAAGVIDIDDIICFAGGTPIACPQGARNIEDLRTGDLVMTVDHGMQRIRWISSTSLSSERLRANPKLRPIIIRQDALSPGVPAQDISVSRQHRILLRSRVAERMFGTHEVLIPAHKLLVLDGVEIDNSCDPVSYHHMLFDEHEVVFAAGLQCESLYLGQETQKMLPPAAYAEVLELFPEIEPMALQSTARLSPQSHRVAKMLDRIAANKNAVLEHTDFQPVAI